jgi:hypothetical protein
MSCPAAGMAGLREAIMDYYEVFFRFPVAQPSGGACGAGSSAGAASPHTSFLRSPCAARFENDGWVAADRRVQARYLAADTMMA